MAPRTVEKNQQIKDERRAQLLNAALTVFARKGFAATKMSDIAAAAGLSHGLTYHYFRSKDEIFTALVKYAMESSSNTVAFFLEMPGSPWDRIRQLTEAMVSYIANGGDQLYYFFIVIQALTSDAIPTEAKELAAKESFKPIEYMARLIVAGQEEGRVVDDDPQKLATAYFSMIQSLAMLKIGVGDSMSIPTADIILRLLKA